MVRNSCYATPCMSPSHLRLAYVPVCPRPPTFVTQADPILGPRVFPTAVPPYPQTALPQPDPNRGTRTPRTPHGPPPQGGPPHSHPMRGQAPYPPLPISQARVEVKVQRMYYFVFSTFLPLSMIT